MRNKHTASAPAGRPVRRGFRNLIAAACFACILPLTASAQTSKGTLAGSVRDTSGAALPNASIVITNEATGETRTVTSNAEGAYRVEAVNPGPYKLHVTREGFASADVQHLDVKPTVLTSYDAQLAIGASNTEITVEALNNSINSDSATVAGTIETQELQKIPIFSLNPAELAATLPGVIQQYVTVQNLGGSGGNGLIKLTVNGARPRANNFMIDSQDVNDVTLGGEAIQPSSPDFFQSVSVLLNDSSAEYGRGGGATINQITKAGTNRFHGTAYEIYIGSGLDAIDGQTRRSKPLPAGVSASGLKARYDQHEYGFTAGGPALRDKLFAFGGADFTRYYGSSLAPTVVLPDTAGYATLKAIAAAGNTQAAALLPYFNNGSYLDPSTFTPGNHYGSIALTARPGCAAPCAVSTSQYTRKPTASQFPATQWTYRIDYTPRQSDTFNVHYFHARTYGTPYYSLNLTTLPGFDAFAGGPSELGGGSWVHVFTPHLTNELRASELRLNSQFAPTAATLANPAAKLYNLAFAGGTGLPSQLGASQNMPQGRNEELYQFQDAVGWTRGRQSIRIGADIGRLLETDLVAQNYLGLETFNAGGAASSLDNYLNNQLGTSGSATRSFGPTRVDPHIWKLAGFVQDDIKLMPDFTVNLGFRYDYASNPLNALPYPSIDINNPFQAINTYVHAQDDKNNFGPRFGFAWVPRFGFLSDGKTVVHGGIGIYYDLFFSNILVNSAQSSPNAPTGTLQSTATGGLTGANTLIASITPVFTATSAVQASNNNMVNPITYQYNVGIERELPFAMKGTLNYIGTRDEKLYSNRQLNYFVNGARINPSRGVINTRDNRGDSEYNSLQLQIERKFRRGLYFNFAYTYAKLLDDSSDVFALFNSPTSYSANLAGNALHQDWGNSAYDRRNVVALTYSYTPAGLHSTNAGADMFLSALTRHFTVSGTTQLYSGLYTTFNVSGIDMNGDGSAANDRPVVSNTSAPFTAVGIDGSYVFGTPGVYYDLAANNATNALTPVQAGNMHFLIPSAANAAGLMSREIGRNSFANPGQQYWNVALEKAIPAPFKHLESSQFILRVEAQQLGNHNNQTFYANNLVAVGTPSFQNVSNSREANYQHLRLWAKYQF